MSDLRNTMKRPRDSDYRLSVILAAQSREDRLPPPPKFRHCNPPPFAGTHGDGFAPLSIRGVKPVEGIVGVRVEADQFGQYGPVLKLQQRVIPLPLWVSDGFFEGDPRTRLIISCGLHALIRQSPGGTGKPGVTDHKIGRAIGILQSVPVGRGSNKAAAIGIFPFLRLGPFHGRKGTRVSVQSVVGLV